MITDLKLLIETCRNEMHDREYTGHHADMINKEWISVFQWFSEQGISEFTTSLGYQYCDEIIGSHIIVDGMTFKQKVRLRAVRMLISYQKDGDFEFRTPRIERSFSGETGEKILLFFQHERSIGRSEKTIECREFYLHSFNQYLVQNKLSFNDMSVDVIEEYFRFMGYELSNRHNSANHLRQLFHYLYDNGYSDRDNAVFVLKDQYRMQNKIPTTYTEEEIARTLAAVDRSSAIGKRDYLIILLAAEYGWRTGDIVNFRFDQIDWDKNIISFDQNKTDIPVEFPLLSSVGNAIIDYLQHSRPKSESPEIIVSAEHGKHGTPLKPQTIHSIVSRYMREADIPHWKEKRHGAHALRHSLASNLLKKNISLPVISTVLGHQRTETTKIYLKVDIEKLSCCPLVMPPLHTPYYKGMKS